MNIQPNTTPQGYEYFTDPVTGELMAVQKSTGEIYKTVTATIVEGSYITTPEMRKIMKTLRENYKQRRACLDELGYFTFVSSSQTFDDISPETAARLVYLSTYLQYDTRALQLTQRTPMKYSDLSSVLMLSSTTTFRFWKSVEGRYAEKDIDNILYLTQPIFSRGKLENTPHDTFQRIYIETVRKLYKMTPTSKHKQLGYVFKMLPYINIEYNILCHTPDEASISDIQPITFAEFCEHIGYSRDHIGRLFKEYQQITFEVDGHLERFCAFVVNDNNIGESSIFINPRVIYSGSDYTKIEVLGAFFNETK